MLISRRLVADPELQIEDGDPAHEVDAEAFEVRVVKAVRQLIGDVPDRGHFETVLPRQRARKERGRFNGSRGAEPA
jgi:hypothetical protein